MANEKLLKVYDKNGVLIEKLILGIRYIKLDGKIIYSDKG